MINLNNTWCYCTHENYRKLKDLNITEVNPSPLNKKYFNIEYNGTDDEILFYQYDDFKKNTKQIHLVDGEFEYVDYYDEAMDRVNDFQMAEEKDKTESYICKDFELKLTNEKGRRLSITQPEISIGWKITIEPIVL